MWDIPIVNIAKVDSRHRVLIPSLKPGKVFAWEDNGKGQIILLEVKPTTKETPSALDGLKPFTKREADRCWGPGSENPEFDDLENHCASLPTAPPEEE